MLEYVQAASRDRCVVCWPAERHEFQHHALNTTLLEEPLVDVAETFLHLAAPCI